MEFVRADLLTMESDGSSTTGSLLGLRSLDLLCANLPYIPSEVLPGLDNYGREPDLALDCGAGGLSLIRSLLKSAPDYMAAGGCVLLEIEAGQGEAVKELACQTFHTAQVRVFPDLAGKNRMLEVVLPLDVQ